MCRQALAAFYSVCLLAPASGQSFSVGLKAGLPLSAPLTAASPGYLERTHRYSFGPSVEVALPHRLAIEADLLYKRLEFGFSGSSGTVEQVSGIARAHRWDLPVLLKYRVTERALRPFVGLGVSFNRVTGIDSPFSEQLAELRHRTTMGFTAAAGIEKRFGVLGASAEVRFTRWADRNFGVSDAALRSNLNQAELLVGLAF